MLSEIQKPANRHSASALNHLLPSLRSVLNASSDLVFIKDVDSVFRACNPAFAAMMGCAESALIGRSDADFYAVGAFEQFHARDREVLDADVPLRIEEWASFPNGQRLLLDTVKTPIHDEAGCVIGLIGICRDVTADRQRDRDYRLLIETAHDGFWKADMDGRLLAVNDAYVKSSGYSREELLNMHIGDLEAKENPEQTAERISRLVQNGTELFETLHRRKDGSIWPVEASISYGDFYGGVMYAFLRDVNLRHRDELLATLRLQLGELAVVGKLDDVLQLALDTAETLTRSNIGFFHFVDADQDTLTLQAWSTNTLKNMCQADAKGQHYPISSAGVWADCLRERRSVLINDYAAYAGKKGMPEGHAPIQRVANVPVMDAQGRFVAVIGVGNKPTDYEDDDVALLYLIGAMTMEAVIARRNADRLRLSSSVFEATQDGILITDSGFAIVAANQAFTAITGYTEAEVFGRNPGEISAGTRSEENFKQVMAAMASTDSWQGEVLGRNKSGGEYVTALSVSAIRDFDGKIKNYLAVFSDLTEKKAAAARVEYLSHYDGLTGLPNRSSFESILGQSVARARRRDAILGVMLIGLDRFKSVNESFGHVVGDEILKLASERLQERLRHEDVLGRIGGDEFAVVIEDVARADMLAYIAQQVIDALAKPFLVGNAEVYVGASVGISMFPLDAADSVGLLRNVDSALTLAKAQGRGVYRFYTEALTLAARERMELNAQLRHALEANEFEVYYQPQVALSDNRVVGVEALVRWRKADGSMISPANFIPVAEETGLIEELGAWVLRTACHDVKNWIDQGLAPISVAVNVSSRQFRVDRLPMLVKQVLDESGLPPHLLELEITESAIMGDGEEAIGLLKTLKSLGVMLAIDDFGTGYSSLSYLKRFPVDKLKIDQSFVRDIPNDISDMEIATTIIAMARHMRLKVLAEGVETQAQRNFLQSQGCDSFQGYLFSKPVPAEYCVAKIQNGNA